MGLFIISHYLWWLCSVSCSGLLLMVVILDYLWWSSSMIMLVVVTISTVSMCCSYCCNLCTVILSGMQSTEPFLSVLRGCDHFPKHYQGMQFGEANIRCTKWVPLGRPNGHCPSKFKLDVTIRLITRHSLTCRCISVHK